MSYNLESEIAKALTNFNEEVAQEIGDIVDDLADKTVAKLKGASPKRTGDYGDDWDSKLNKRGERVIYQPKEYRIAHLLEFGHARRNGGRNVGAKPHIKEIFPSICSIPLLKYIKPPHSAKMVFPCS